MEKMLSKIPIQIVENAAGVYETKNRFYLFRITVMWLLTGWVALKKIFFGPRLKTNTFWFDGASSICREIKKNSINWRALEIIYTFVPLTGRDLESAITNFWSQMANVRAVRNRLKLVKTQAKNILEELAAREPEIRILSIASGSARAIIEEMAEIKKRRGETIRFKTILLDRDPTAGEYARELGRKLGIENEIIFVNKTTTDLEQVAGDFQPHLVEMVGFLDYRPDEKAIRLLERIRKILIPGGVLLVGQMAPNPEKFFLLFVVDWPVIQRSPDQFAQIIEKAGFEKEKCRIIYEPLKIHGIAVCQK